MELKNITVSASILPLTRFLVSEEWCLPTGFGLKLQPCVNLAILSFTILAAEQ